MVFIVLCVPLFSQALMQVNGAVSGISFYDHFDGNQVNTEKWVVQENTNMSGLPAFGGSVKVTESEVALASTGDGTSFPCVTSAFNPFASSTDFVAEFDITYDCLSDWGSGLWISKGQVVVEGESSPEMIFQVWGDNEASWTQSAVRVNLLGSQVYRSEIEGWEPSADTHTFRLQYVEGVYTVFVDGVEAAAEASAIRPDTLGFGHPPAYYVPFERERAIGNVGGWSSFRIGLIKVSSPAVVSFSTSTSQTMFGSAVDIIGTLRSRDGTPLVGETVILFYMIPAVGKWNPITSAVTEGDGSFAASWLPTATGVFGLKVEFGGNENFAGTSEEGNVSVVRGSESGDIPAESNSTSLEASALPAEQIAGPELIAPAGAMAFFGAGMLVYSKKRKR
jgi:hypothetical protein